MQNIYYNFEWSSFPHEKLQIPIYDMNGRLTRGMEEVI